MTNRRLVKAHALIATTDFPLHQIAAQAGFSDQSHLSNVFRKAYGCAPTEVRKNLQIMRTDFQDSNPKLARPLTDTCTEMVEGEGVSR